MTETFPCDRSISLRGSRRRLWCTRHSLRHARHSFRCEEYSCAMYLINICFTLSVLFEKKKCCSRHEMSRDLGSENGQVEDLRWILVVITGACSLHVSEEKERKAFSDEGQNKCHERPFTVRSFFVYFGPHSPSVVLISAHSSLPRAFRRNNRLGRYLLKNSLSWVGGARHTRTAPYVLPPLLRPHSSHCFFVYQEWTYHPCEYIITLALNGYASDAYKKKQSN